LSHGEDAIGADVGGEEIAVIFQLVFVSEIDPSAEEELFSLLLIDLVVGKDAAGDQAVLPIDHLLDGFGSIYAKAHVLDPRA